MSFIRKIFGLGPKVDCHELLKNGAILIDVRTSKEYAQGKVSGSQNVPLDGIEGKLKKIKALNKPIVLVCASGMRSSKATSLLKQNGVEAFNGGSWRKFSETEVDKIS
jgi:phage shock protein E